MSFCQAWCLAWWTGSQNIHIRYPYTKYYGYADTFQFGRKAWHKVWGTNFYIPQFQHQRLLEKWVLNCIWRMLLFMYSSIYTIRFGTSIPCVFSLWHVLAWWVHLLVHLGCCTITFLLLSPTLASVHTLGVWYMFFLFALFCQVYCFWEVYIVKSLNFCITPRVKLVKIYFWSNITILLKYFLVSN
jgi:hypothetical protein